ncbi:MAG TPA: response regulator transcription factor [Chthoniobacterales bacterium]|nr:response regulator transcription factor [Chthoniobacterales bacterium]
MSFGVRLADDHLIVREGLVTVLSEEPDFEFIGFAEDGEQACEEYAKMLPDVLLLDLRMPKRDGRRVETIYRQSWVVSWRTSRSALN